MVKVRVAPRFKIRIRVRVLFKIRYSVKVSVMVGSRYCDKIYS